MKMTEQKKPIAGEWWFPKSGKPYLCVATNARGGTVFKSHTETFHVCIDDFHWKHWHHGPQCDSFDWVEPVADVWPKWYVTLIQNAHYYRLDSSQCGQCIGENSFERVSSVDVARIRSSPGPWIEVTEAEALARVEPLPAICPMCGINFIEPGTGGCAGCNEFALASVTWRSLPSTPVGTVKITPVESLDDWVTQDREPMRVGDQGKWDNGQPWWQAQSQFVDRFQGKACHGMVDPDDGLTLSVRCLRRDLPPVKSPDDWVVGPLPVPSYATELWIDSEWRPVSYLDGHRAAEHSITHWRCLRIDLPPVELPDDWVEINDLSHMPRDGVDWFNGGDRFNGGHQRKWIMHEPCHVRSSVGEYAKSSPGGKFRCRREDLPKQPLMAETYAEQPAVNRVAVRLWRDKESGQIVGTLPGDEYAVGDLAEEVKSDGNGGWELRIPQ